MRLGCIVRCYHLTDYLARVLRNYDEVDKIVVMNVLFGGVKEAEDDTEEIVKRLNRPNVVLYKDHTTRPEQFKVFEIAKGMLKDCDWIFISDADEFLLKSDQQRIIKETEYYVHQVFCNVVDYCENTDYVFPMRTHKPVVCVRPDVQFVGTRAAEGHGKLYKDMYMHHFGCAIKDKEWKQKNIWYPKHSFDAIVCQAHVKSEKPQELIDALSDSKA